jgi:excisionase family DNA binding protein
MRAKSENTREPMMTVGELAAYWRCHQTTIYRLLRQGKLPAFRIGSDWRFNRETIDAFTTEAAKVRLGASLHVQINGRRKRLD